MIDIFGEWSQNYPYTMLLLVLMGVDIVTGLLRAMEEKKLSSDISGRGMRRKAMMLILVLIGKALEIVTGPAPVTEAIAIGFCVSEGLSVLENAALLGVPIPRFLTQFFLQLQAAAANSAPFRLGDSPADHDRILAQRDIDPGHTKNNLRPDVLEEAADRLEKDGM